MIFPNGQESEWAGKIKKVNGITVVQNPKTPIYKKVIFNPTEDLKIGEAEGRKEYMFSDIDDLKRSVAVDNEGDIYVADKKNAHQGLQ